MPEMVKLLEHPNVKVVRGDVCAHGMKLRDESGTAPVLKPTGWCSNSRHILKHMQKLCTRNHRHVSLQHGRPKYAAIYPHKLCLSILRGLKDELNDTGLSELNSIGTVNEERKL